MCSQSIINSSYNFISLIFPIIIAVAGVAISIIAYFASWKFYYMEKIHKFSDRLYELNNIILQNSILIPFFSENSFSTNEYFIPQTPHDETYFKIKTLIYFQLNLFDEIISTAWKEKKMEEHLEFDNWKLYIIEKLRHPLYKELYKKEKQNWGKKFGKFVSDYKEEINKPPCEEYVL